MDSYELLINRRSIRKYEDKKISDELVTKLVESGLSAPSARNLQPYHFVVVRDRNKLDTLADVRSPWKLLKGSNCAICVVADVRNYDTVSTDDMYIQDCSAATENILLAAEALGLGGCWLGLYPREEPVNAVSKILELPEKVIPITLISVGYPAEKREAHSDFDINKIHFEKF